MRTKSKLTALESSDEAALERWNQDLENAKVNKVITFENVNERAIDITMAVLINSDVDFRQWMASQILGVDSASFVHFQARWGVCCEGEADMVWFLVAKNQRTALMFENKINCGPQDSQCDRYRQRAEHWKLCRLINASRIILFSPRNYRSIEAEKYDTRLDYEAVLEWLGQSASGMRKELAWLLSQGLCKPQGVWTSVGTDPELLDWIRWLYDLQAQKYPNLWMVGRRSTGKGGKVDPWIERHFSKQGHSFSLRLKLGLKPNGDGWGSQPHLSAVDLHINGEAYRSSFLMPELQKMTAGSPLRPRITGKSIAIGKDIPVVRGKAYDEGQASEVFKAAQQIQDWFERNQQALLMLLAFSESETDG